MLRGLVLDPRTGKPIKEAGQILSRRYGSDGSIPDDIQRLLDKSSESHIMGSGVAWRDVLTPRRVLSADGVQVVNTTTEKIICPDFTFAGDALEVGDVFEYSLWGNMSTVITTPGTITIRLRWGGEGGTLLCASGAYAPDPTAAAANLSYKIKFTVVCRAVGTAGSLFAMGEMDLHDFDDATAATLKGNLDMGLIPSATPAAVAVNTTVASALSPTVQFSVANAGNQLTNHIALLESLN